MPSCHVARAVRTPGDEQVSDAQRCRSSAGSRALEAAKAAKKQNGRSRSGCAREAGMIFVAVCAA
jgi:hypothetical protein